MLRLIIFMLAAYGINWFRLHKGEVKDKLYEKLDVETTFVKKYKSAYEEVSDYISKQDYLDKAKLLHKEFRYDVVKFMNLNLPSPKLKAVKKIAKHTSPVPFNSLPTELKENVNEVADKYVLVLLQSCEPKVINPQIPRRRRRR